jgi:hypothetical protein
VSQEVAQTAGIGLAEGGVRRTALAVDMLIGQVVEFIGAVLVLPKPASCLPGSSRAMCSTARSSEPMNWRPFCFCGWR